MSEENAEDLPDSPNRGDTVYYIVTDNEGIWMMAQTPSEDDEIM